MVPTSWRHTRYGTYPTLVTYHSPPSPRTRRVRHTPRPRRRAAPLEPWQAPEFLAHIDRARAHTDPWIPWATYSTDLDSARATLQSYADKQAADRGRIFGIWREGTLVGGVMFVHFDAAAGTCEIGVWSEPAGEGHGLVTAAARHLLTHAFTTRGLHRAEWRTTPATPAAAPPPSASA